MAGTTVNSTRATAGASTESGKQPAPHTLPAPKKLPRWALLDGLRLAAALLVVLYHYVGSAKSDWGVPNDEAWPLLHKLAALGNLGVPLFFIISGLVVFRSLEGRSTARFAGSRIGRIAPAFWLSVLIAGPLQLFFFDYKDLDWGDIWMNLTLVGPPIFGEISGDGFSWVDTVYWTLWIEARFYIMLVVARWVLRSLKVDRPAGWTAICGAWVAFSAWTIHEHGVPELQSWVSWLAFPTYAGLFAGGMLIHIIAKHGFTWARGGVLAAAVLQAAWATALDLPGRTESVTGVHVPAFVFATAVLAFFGMILAVVMTPTLIRIRWSWLTTAGALTFPVYLIHSILGRFVIESLAPWMPRELLLVLLLGMVLGVAWLINKFIEEPLGARLTVWVERGLDVFSDIVTARRSRQLVCHLHLTSWGPCPTAVAEPRDTLATGAGAGGAAGTAVADAGTTQKATSTA
ncbi:MAG: acyltransferase family protein [Galactobacter sp.]